MLSRIPGSNEEICEILLSKKQVMKAIKFAQKHGLDHLPSRKFLQVALDSGDRTIFYNVYTFLKEKNLIGTTGYEVYKKHFQDTYNQD